jgi:hypothetical protein
MAHEVDAGFSLRMSGRLLVPIVVYKVHQSTFPLTLIIISLLFFAHLSSPLEVCDMLSGQCCYLSAEASFCDPTPGWYRVRQPSYRRYFAGVCTYRFHFITISVVGWGTIIQAGRSLVRVPMRSLNFFQFT